MTPPLGSRPVPVRSALARSLHRALALIAAAAAVLGVVQLALLPRADPNWPVMVAGTAIFWVYAAIGLIAWRRRPSNPLGQLIVLAGMTVYLAMCGNTEVPVLMGIGAVCATLILPAMLHLLLAFPSGHLRSRRAVGVVVAGYVLSTLLEAPQYLFDPAGPAPALVVADAPEVARAALTVQAIAGAGVMAAAVVILAGRLRRADRAHRRVLAPLFSYGIFAAAATPLSGSVLVGVLGLDSAVQASVQYLVIAGVPVAFALGMLRGGFARTGQLEELGTWLGAAPATREVLETAIARALGDASVGLSFWVAERGGYVDAEGRAVPTPAAHRGWSRIVLDGRLIGAIEYDRRLLRDDELVRTAGNVVAIAVDRERLTAELRASRRALIRSRERLVEAADRERRRIARDLHDGLQSQLVMLAVDAQRLASAEPAAVAERATGLRREIDAAAADLRRLVHDLVPAALIERGLFAAAEELVDRMPIPTRLVGGAGPLDDAASDTAYFVIAEALTNVVKHSQARSAEVRLERRDGTLRLDVRDDGVGGATFDGGTGLRGLADRVDAAGGTLVIAGAETEGTHLCVTLPCAS
ncbi:sensor histidine kinase [Microbacterium sp. zg.Y1090]|uniref:sensor histidine kinase n=1 Tax=Microbacterium TaxID=33882 RepID=UPI00214B1310|nr:MULTISPECIES: sensor histidine kinase [unclassified Microbacterium]MCR2813937.1 sensor histidine kinase [Microbacterium sp. zg.Y1084]MCR2819211.1 sensor histidine kinase [Microbacterium sp. zg.Y1090]MDL5487120.1 sensor histidine kinase [Microbacterium sp. zg-Y1211]WIM28195.1 sensor histidine kinase [Microbacterium sp. zg-Y1090]